VIQAFNTGDRIQETKNYVKLANYSNPDLGKNDLIFDYKIREIVHVLPDLQSVISDTKQVHSTDSMPMAVHQGERKLRQNN
jgi:hypothetical protein